MRPHLEAADDTRIDPRDGAVAGELDDAVAGGKRARDRRRSLGASGGQRPLGRSVAPSDRIADARGGPQLHVDRRVLVDLIREGEAIGAAGRDVWDDTLPLDVELLDGSGT